MSYEIYRYIFYGGAILATVMLAITVILFFVYKIPTVIGDLTGANARKAIENIRNQNENSGDKLYKTSQVNRERGKITDKISPSGNLLRGDTDALGGGAMATEKIGMQESAPETTVLSTANETVVLDSNVDETTVLDAQSNIAPLFRIEYEITYIHSDEVIA